MKSVRTIETLIKEDFKMMKAQIIYYKEDGNHFTDFILTDILQHVVLDLRKTLENFY